MRVAIVLVVIMTFVSNDISAAHFRDEGFLAHHGILESMRIKPRIPANGESFTINLSGSWPEVNPDYVCMAPLKVEQDISIHENRIHIVSYPESDASYCDQPPASWDFDVTIPATAWAAVDEDGFLLVEHMLWSGINTMTVIDQVFDLRLGTHEVPAFIDSGFWISPELPNEGMLVEQLGTRVLFYGLRYDRNAQFDDQGEPVWQLVSGEMYGDSTLGKSYRYDWPMDENGQPAESPTEEQLLTENESGSIIVNDYNHIRAFTERHGVLGRYHDYHRFTFGVDKSRLPKYVPPLSGNWTLHGYDGQNRAFTASLEFLQGSSPATNQYRFASVGDDWVALCSVTPPGTGDCSIERGSDGAKFDFPLTAFQGNLARGSLQAADSTNMTGVLIREPWQLPELGGQ